MNPISLKELHEKYNKLNSNEILLDVRRPEEFSEGHIPGAKNISHETVLDHLDELKKYSHIYIYCRSGGRVQAATTALMSAGIKNITSVIQGGMPDWIEAGFPVER